MYLLLRNTEGSGRLVHVQFCPLRVLAFSPEHRVSQAQQRQPPNNNERARNTHDMREFLAFFARNDFIVTRFAPSILAEKTLPHTHLFSVVEANQVKHTHTSSHAR